MKRCPYCAEEIQDAAIKCRYCNERLDVAARSLASPCPPPRPQPFVPRAPPATADSTPHPGAADSTPHPGAGEARAAQAAGVLWAVYGSLNLLALLLLLIELARLPWPEDSFFQTSVLVILIALGMLSGGFLAAGIRVAQMKHKDTLALSIISLVLALLHALALGGIHHPVGSFFATVALALLLVAGLLGIAGRRAYRAALRRP